MRVTPAAPEVADVANGKIIPHVSNRNWKALRTIAGCLIALGLLTGPAGNAQTPTHAPPPEISCPADKVVWVNTQSGVYHYRGERYFGSTKQGKFICEKDALQEGDRPTRNGQ
jgi:hypothetical protein